MFSAESYPLLYEHVEQISLTRLDGTAIIGWDCSNLTFACVGPVASLLRNRILLKSRKPFTWVPGAEKCLLNYASGATVTSRGGPPPPDPSIWDNKDLIAACEASAFDSIYFWERVRKWVHKLK